jgi:hypothetical protein
MIADEWMFEKINLHKKLGITNLAQYWLEIVIKMYVNECIITFM